MRSPADMEVIQIEITNACLHSCSNCTRFCGHHKRPFFMDWPTYERAVDSLRGYDGIIGLMGGEPLLHRDFERMTLHLRRHHGMVSNLGATRRPVRDFIAYTRARHNALRVVNRSKGPGLFTSMPRQYARHYELIQDSFLFQNLNDHCNPSYHQPLLVARKDLGVGDEEWHKLRDACWIQNCWSASITPKGAFFCEVAGALDLLFDGPGGWVIEPDWWRRTPADFADQLHWCELCGAALDTSRRNANDEMDDVSPTLLDRLRTLDSPKVRKGKIVVLTANQAGRFIPSDGSPAEQWADLKAHEYISEHSQRLGTANRNLRPHAVHGIVVCPPDWQLEQMEQVEQALASALDQLDQVAVLFPRHSVDTISSGIRERLMDQVRGADAERLRIFFQKPDGRPALGPLLLQAMRGFQGHDWMVVLSPGQTLPHAFREDISATFLNPGVFHVMNSVTETRELPSKPGCPDSSQAVETSLDLDSPAPSSEMNAEHAVFPGPVLFHAQAQALRKAGFDGIRDCANLRRFQELWPEDKRVLTGPLAHLPETDAPDWARQVDRDVLQDQTFRDQLSLVLSQGVPDNSPLLVTQSASMFLTRALVALLTDLGHAPHLLTHRRFADFFQEALPDTRIWSFDHCPRIQLAPLKPLLEQISSQITFAGAVVPYSTPRNVVEPEDGYQEIEQVAASLAGRIICRVNLKRRFVTGHADHAVVYENRWGY